jgi:hypothetical protein
MLALIPLGGKVVVWEDTDDAALNAPPPAPPRTMHMSDLRHGFSQWNAGATSEAPFINGTVALMGLLVLVVLLRKLRESHEQPSPRLLIRR